ncbi:MAG: outer membrane protein assembly factor BamA [Lentimicrobiaceae bacterium]|nr:outer membrane protein assembly factor BamA [Lentimicrobiaceae bacterium]
MLRYYKILILLIPIFTFNIQGLAQIQVGNDLSEIDYSMPRDYEIGGITVTGVKYLEPQVLVMLSGLQVGETIEVPGDKITNAIRKLWEQGLFEDVSITCVNKIGRKIFLNIDLKERPRISKFSFKGVKKSEADELRSKINLTRGDVATEHTYTKTKRIIEDYFFEKGFHNVNVMVASEPDTTRDNYVNLTLDIDKGPKVRIAEIIIEGNEDLTDAQLRKAMKETKVKGNFDPLNPLGTTVVNSLWDFIRLKPKQAMTRITDYFCDNYRPRIFKSSKYLEKNYEDDKQKIIDRYNQNGYRDAYIISDSIYRIDDKNLGINIKVQEGNKYYFRNIDWVGNTKYDTAYLNRVLGIRKGDVYNRELLQTNLTYNEGGYDISALYMDDGYLFFSVDPVEVRVENDSIDLEIRMYEGDQATIGKVTIKGNTKTNDHVAMRELYTKPGQLFSRSDLIRTTRELAALGYFNAETLNPDIKPDPTDGTVDIEYQVEETSSDQIELSAGWGYNKLILTLGLTLNNFSFKNMFKKGSWTPLPGGDGQKLSLRVQTHGTSYLYYGASFTEPWLGGKKPNAFTASIYHSVYTNEYSKSSPNFASFKTTGISFGLGRRLTWPDDYFTIYHGINLMRYKLNNYSTIFNFGTGMGEFNVISYNISVGRNSVSQPIYPRYGSELVMSLELTPPYSTISGVDYEEEYPGLENKAKREDAMYHWVEFHKWKFKLAWYTELYDKLVLMTRVRFGYLGSYNQNIGVTPFQRFYLGGDGLANYNFDGREIIGMRGYGNQTLTPYYYADENLGGNIFTKYTMELRYPLSLNPTATIYALAFVEAGNDWLGVENFNPFDVYRSAGLGVRIYLPMFGMLGIDWGYGFDDVYGVNNANKSQFHFSIGGSID